MAGMAKAALKRTRLRRRQPRSASRFDPTPSRRNVKSAHYRWAVPENAVEYVGHATVLVDLDGTRFLTDPLLRRRVAISCAPFRCPRGRGRGRRRSGAHAHHDHLDLGSLRMSTATCRLSCREDSGARSALRTRDRGRRGRRGQRREPCRACDSCRVRWAPNPRAERAALGYVVLGPRRIFFGGETGLLRGMKVPDPGARRGTRADLGWERTLGRGKTSIRGPRRKRFAVCSQRSPCPSTGARTAPTDLALPGRLAFLDEPGQAFLRAAAELAPDVETRLLRPARASRTRPFRHGALRRVRQSTKIRCRALHPTISRSGPGNAG